MVDAGATLELPPVPESLRSIAIDRTSPDYPLMRSSYMRVGKPALILRARHEEDVRAAVAYAAHARALSAGVLPFSVRSGGHGISGQSTNDGGIILDLSLMRRIDIQDAARGLVRVEPGAVWGEVATTLGKHDLVLTSGNFAGTGVGGLAGSGGLGYFARHQGMTLDRIRAARVVTADGTVQHVYEEHEPDLFWAIRGGASQVGVVTEFLFEAEPLPKGETIHQQVQHLVDDLPAFVEQWGALMRDAPREFTSFLMLHGQEGRCLSVAQNVWFGTDVERAKPVLEKFAALAPLAGHSARITPYKEIVVGARHSNVGQQTIKMRDALVDTVDRRAGQALKDAMCHHVTAVGELRSVGGAINDVAADATAYAHRHQEGLLAIWVHPADISEIDAAWKPVDDIASGMYSFYSSDTRPRAVELSWPGETGKRLRAISERVDPEGLFTYGLSVRNTG